MYTDPLVLNKSEVIMVERTIAVHVFIDGLLQYLHHKEDKKRKVSDTQALTPS